MLLGSPAQILPSLLGEASERTGMDKYIEADTSKHRTHSLYRQGHCWCGATPKMREAWIVPLMTAVDAILLEHPSRCTVLDALCTTRLRPAKNALAVDSK